MTFDELKAHFDGQSYRKIAKSLGVSPSQLTYYKKHGIPLGRQVMISQKTDGALKITTHNKLNHE